MTSAVSTVSINQNAPLQPANGGAPHNDSASVSTAAATDSKPLTGNPNTPISPRITFDPQAGIITEFLSSNGQVQSQLPSAAVVAYLHAGLTSDGRVKETPETQNQDHQKDSSVFA